MTFDDRLPLLLQLGFRESGVAALREYLEMLWATNEELNLVSRKMIFPELIDNHIVDCLLPLPRFPEGVKVAADFGSGGGLPGVLYAIQFPRIRYLLFEKSPLKRRFLERCKALAPNLEVRAEIPVELQDVELVTARAFKPIDVILDMSRSYHAGGGRYFLLKGRRKKIEEELTLARKKFKSLEASVVPLDSPVLDVERHLVMF